ncbi:MAG: hypothetical protein AVDCRST_MAG91-2031 [uncultured Sphingomonadaceae bacterium]|uniref:N-acetyltransferase domain-containing protein n=1 Tax=uncultured Sphingomonadaceae bacterium TaxID=169976 RepID=A0A6J4TAC5_9SPHN|nr:MAG: hypothetical protein AVDCRST_MAG91-2031 [uncultured Sphingomonadaceae bacterium]
MTDPFPIRVAIRADVGGLHSLVERAYRGDEARRGWTHEADLLGGQRTDAEALRAIVDDPDQRILIATDAGAVVGCVQLSAKGAGLCYLGLLSVDPSRQAAGLGKRLLDVAERYARDQLEARTMEMTVIKQRGELVRYYQRRGYALTGEERPFPLDDPRFGLPRTRELVFVVMAKEIG